VRTYSSLYPNNALSEKGGRENLEGSNSAIEFKTAIAPWSSVPDIFLIFSSGIQTTY
jgi:hypothetical protein